ncbi:hypothetical protein [Leisingera aquaemixtae]|uniref:hypothetical protein n=1 Tax=Leisingera aquaemixtae TaxID=1396826 RepID=UPI0011AE2052|nr:hypothetical protein [Leisingera aquaemixtae]
MSISPFTAGILAGTSGVIFPAPAKAEITAAGVAATISIASALSNMFGKRGGEGERHAILNAKLDTIIQLQQLTLESISEVHSKLEELEGQIPNFLENESLRKQQVDALTHMRRLQDIQYSILAGNNVEDIKNDFDQLSQAVWTSVSNLDSDVKSSNLQGDAGYDGILFTVTALNTYFMMAPGLKNVALDSALKEFPTSARYRGLVRAMGDVIEYLKTSILPTQVEFQQRMFAAPNRKKIGAPWVYWYRYIAQQFDMFDPSIREHEKIQIDTFFRNYITMIPCRNGHNSNDIEWAKRHGTSVDPYWRTFELLAPVKLILNPTFSDTPTEYRVSPFVGFDQVDFYFRRNGPISVRQISEFNKNEFARVPRGVWPGNRQRPTDYLHLPLDVGEFFCPGFKDTDPQAYAQQIANRVLQGIRGNELRVMSELLLEMSMRRWREVGFIEMDSWLTELNKDISEL